MSHRVTTVQYRTPTAAPAFVRLLARLGGAELPDATPALSERLGQWIDWNRAVSLSRALDGAVAPEAGAPASDDTHHAAVARVRASLSDAILRGPPPDAGDDDFAPYRRYCLERQRAMLTGTGPLRGRLRDALAQRGGDLARLAEVDAVMEMTLSPRENALLANTPVLLGLHFDRLRAGAEAASGPAWRALFRRDLQDALLAELDLRFHPLDALLAALRPS
ncbi:DUF3348 domain-containing protein [Pseudoxanthomonas sp. LjRoot125]|uniref:DUF3348 family protein n=1 Tax=Pseudoxanthomonas sp. LjRoot125 TaxID=3342258 RepID=UPI003E114818